MRTTLTLDDDLAKELRDESRRSGRAFKDVVNETLRRGLTAEASPGRRPGKFKVTPKGCGFRPGVDVSKLNQLVDELEIDDVATLVIRDR